MVIPELRALHENPDEFIPEPFFPLITKRETSSMDALRDFNSRSA